MNDYTKSVVQGYISQIEELLDQHNHYRDEYIKQLKKEDETIARLNDELKQLQEDFKNED
jgi:hypothetical protein